MVSIHKTLKISCIGFKFLICKNSSLIERRAGVSLLFLLFIHPNWQTFFSTLTEPWIFIGIVRMFSQAQQSLLKSSNMLLLKFRQNILIFFNLTSPFHHLFRFLISFNCFCKFQLSRIAVINLTLFSLDKTWSFY